MAVTATPPLPSGTAAHPVANAIGADDAIALAGATKRFDNRAVVDDLTFAVGRGQILGLIGPSGCGKTTTVRLVMGVLGPDAGQVRVFGVDPLRFGHRLRARLGYMPQHFVLYPELTVRENLHFVASCYGVSMRGRGARVNRMLELVELTDARDRPAEMISGGMKRRLELACTLLHEPELIVVDEPTAGIDPVLRQKFWTHFRELRDQGRTLLVTTQYVTEAEYCDRIVALNDGRLVAQGTPDEVRRAAIGGEVIDLVAEGLTRPIVAQLAQLDGVTHVERRSIDELRLTVEHAGSATPLVMAAMQGAGISVGSLTEYRPNFDEVFVKLMADAAANGGRAGAPPVRAAP